MTVKELREALKDLDQELDVYTETRTAFDEITEVNIRKWEDQKIVVLG